MNNTIDQTLIQPSPTKGLWRQIRGFVMFGVACVLSPCCTPILIAFALGVLVGTPAALWIGANRGWLYGALTLLAMVSGVMAFRWSRTRK